MTEKYLEGIPEDSRAAKEHGFLQKDAITSELVTKIKKLNSFAKQRGQTLAAMSLAWVLKQKSVASALIGASRVKQLTDNLKALDNLSFTQDELDQINIILNEK